jgi:hypothetical protein
MPDRDTFHASDTQALPLGASELVLGPIGYSTDLAERLAEAGASDKAIDAAGGEGTAERLRVQQSDPAPA